MEKNSDLSRLAMEIQIPATLVDAILEQLQILARPSRLHGMARYGIDTSKALGVKIPELRTLARICRKGHSPEQRHELAQGLWQHELHEARILASMLDAPALVTPEQMEAWAQDFTSWDLCDQCCSNLFRHTPHAWEQAQKWASLGRDGPEFVVRAGFVLMATLCVKDKTAPDEAFEPFWPLLLTGSEDGRAYVKKGVSWALRQLGKRNATLYSRAVMLARKMEEQGSSVAVSIARETMRELQGEKVLHRLGLL